MILHKPFSLFFFIFSTVKMIRKMIMASIRMPITGHNGPNGSATRFEKNTWYNYKSMCVYLIQKYCPINNLRHGYIVQKKNLTLYSLYIDIVFTGKGTPPLLELWQTKRKPAGFFCASWLVNNLVNSYDMYLYTTVLLTFSAGGPLVTFINGQNY